MGAILAANNADHDKRRWYGVTGDCQECLDREKFNSPAGPSPIDTEAASTRSVGKPQVRRFEGRCPLPGDATRIRG
jgi:hypothetical protein